MADLSINVDGMEFENPFVIGSGPPGTNARVISRCFDAGWGGVIAKTTSLTDTPVVNLAPRYAKYYNADKDVIGFQNVELISDRPFEDWEEDFKLLKEKYPKKMLIASLMESFDKARWQELAERSAACGVDAFELNFSCPHGHPETGMGAAMGQNPDMVREVTSWVVEACDIPVWSKMTPNITDIATPAQAARDGGAHCVSAINTILAVTGVNLKTLRPLPTVADGSIPGGYSGQAVKPIALRMVKEICMAMPNYSVSGMGGVWNSDHAIEFLLMGANTVQVCTGAMLLGYDMVEGLCTGLSDFMDEHGFTSVEQVVGQSLQYFSTHHDLVERQDAARKAKAEARKAASNRDGFWGKDSIQDETASLTTNEG